MKYNIHTVHTNIDISIDPSINYLIQLFTSGPVRNAYTDFLRTGQPGMQPLSYKYFSYSYSYTFYASAAIAQ